MNPYIAETEYAVRNLLDLAHREELLLAEQSRKLADAEARFKVHSLDFQTSDLNEDFTDAYVMAAFGRMSKAAKEKDELGSKVGRLQVLVGAHQGAVQSVCASVLQIAKQGISLVHGGLAKAPPGRMIGKLALRDVVWQGRNQAIHYEEGSFSTQVTDVFAKLAASHGPEFSLALHARQSRAKQIVQFLGWMSYDTYEADMTTLLP